MTEPSLLWVEPPSSLSLSSGNKYFHPLIIFMTPGWTRSSMSMPHWYWGRQHWTPSTPHQCWAGRQDPLSRPAGSALLNAAQDAAGRLRSRDVLAAHVPLVHQDPRGLVSQAAFQPVSASLCWPLGLFLSWVRNLHYLIHWLLQLEPGVCDPEELFEL